MGSNVILDQEHLAGQRIRERRTIARSIAFIIVVLALFAVSASAAATYRVPTKNPGSIVE